MQDWAEGEAELHAVDQSLSPPHGGSRTGNDFSEIHLRVIGYGLSPARAKPWAGRSLLPRAMPEQGPAASQLQVATLASENKLLGAKGEFRCCMSAPTTQAG